MTDVTGTGAGSYIVTLSGPVPPRNCVTITFTDANAGQKLQYEFLPGDVGMDGVSNTQDVLALIQALNNGSAN